MSRKRRIPLSKPPESRLFEADYDCWVNIVRLRQWVSTVDEYQQPCHQTPTLLLVLSPISIIMKVEPIIHMGPVKASDFEVLRPSIPPNSRVYCPLKYEQLLCEGLGNSVSSLNLTIVGRPDSEIPLAFEEIAEQFASNIPSRCALCDGSLTNVPYAGQPALPCVCAGMEAVPRMTNTSIRSFFETASTFWQAQPWLHMRINHVVRVEVANSPFRYVQILGGTGCCDVAVMVHTNWDDVQNENWSVSTMHLNPQGVYTVVKAEFQPPGQSCRSWKDLDFISNQERLGTPVHLPDPENPDPVTQPVLPMFTRISIRRKNGANDLDVRQVAATYEETMYLQVAMWVIVKLLNDHILVPVSGSPVGDYRRYYAFDTTLPLPELLMLHAKLQPHQRTVSVRYPAIDEPTKMSELQVLAVERGPAPTSTDSKKKKKKKKSKSPTKPTENENEVDMDVSALARMREIMARKAIANGFYQKGLYAEAYAHYTLVIRDFVSFRSGLDAHHQQDPQMLVNGDNLYSNRAQAALRLEWYTKVVEDCNRVIPFMVSHCSNIYVVRCLHARARAYAALHHYDNSFDDWHVLAIEAQKGNADVPPKNYLAEQGQLIQKKLAKCQVDAQWRMLATSGTHLTRFFHTTVLHPDGTSLLVFGGRSTTLFGAEENDTCVHQYIFESQSWLKISGSGQKPPCLSGHTAVVHDRFMYVYGGSPLNDADEYPGRDIFFQLNVDTWTWKRIKASNEPVNRNGHTATVYKGQMILFGGYHGTNDKAKNDMDVFNFKTKKWTVWPQKDPNKGPPPSIAFHMAWIHDTNFYIFGGKVDTESFYEYTGKLYAYDLEKHTWLGHPALSTSSGMPPIYPGPRSESIAFCHENTMLQFGGYAELPVGSKYYGDGYRLIHHGDKTVSWSKINAPISQPMPQSRAGCTLTMDPARKRAILYGGYETMRNDIVHGDVWELNLQSLGLFADKTSEDTSFPSKDKPPVSCGTCGRVGKWKKCARCNERPYCSQTCQKKDWPAHKTTCRSP